ncbi:hypothetical protein EDB87DRAFT_680599 [Lactarius vividus]|nr:hypothetical protein EDB87DRAFT_680599 [Lactarius vividus]
MPQKVSFRPHTFQFPPTIFLCLSPPTTHCTYRLSDHSLFPAYAIDQRFENFRYPEVTTLAAASLDVNFKEELKATERWLKLKVLSSTGRTAALDSPLQHSTQVQIHFFITVLQPIARASLTTTFLSPGRRGFHEARGKLSLPVRISSRLG